MRQIDLRPLNIIRLLYVAAEGADLSYGLVHYMRIGCVIVENNIHINLLSSEAV